MSKPEEFKFDSRVRDRFLRSRVLSGAEVQKHLDGLPDLEGEYEVLSDTPQPAVSPPRSEVHEEPLVFDGIRRLQALSEAQSPPPVPRHVPPSPPSGLPAYREPEARPLGTPLRSALMESEISGVGAGAVSAALGAMAAEARGASVFGVPTSIPHQPPAPPAEEVVPPVTQRSEATAQPAVPRADVATSEPEAAAALEGDEDEDEDEEDDLDDDDDDDDDDDVEADDAEADEVDAAAADVAGVDADEDEVDADDDDDDDDAEGATDPDEEDLA